MSDFSTVDHEGTTLSGSSTKSLPLDGDREASKCGNCRFWKPSESARIAVFGACRARPPAIIETFIPDEHSGMTTDERVLMATRWPATTPGCWCGEFVHKDRMQ